MAASSVPLRVPTTSRRRQDMYPLFTTARAVFSARISAAALLFLVSGVVHPAHADSLQIGETTGFRGAFCKFEEATEQVARIFESDGESAGITALNRMRWCSMATIVITLLRIVRMFSPKDSEHEFAIVEVQTADGQKHFLFTSMKVNPAGVEI